MNPKSAGSMLGQTGDPEMPQTHLALHGIFTTKIPTVTFGEILQELHNKQRLRMNREKCPKIEALHVCIEADTVNQSSMKKSLMYIQTLL